MKTKEEILIKNNITVIVDNRYCLKYGHNIDEINRAMQEYSDHENARLTAINEKQAELIVYLKRQLKKRYPAFDSLKLCKLESELQSLQSGEKEEIIKIDINDPDFNEPI